QIPNMRATSDKSAWVKVDPARIPNLDNVNINSAEKAYLRAVSKSEETQHGEAERETSAGDKGEREETETFEPIPNSGSELKALFQKRPNLYSINLLNKIRIGNFVKFIVLTPPQRDGLLGQ